MREVGQRTSSNQRLIPFEESFSSKPTESESNQMSGIQLGEKQVSLDDIDAIVINSIPIVVDPAFMAKVANSCYSSYVDPEAGKGKARPSRLRKVRNASMKSPVELKM